MKNTSMLKVILQLYTVSMDMDEDENIYLTIIHKNEKTSVTFIDKTYTVVIRKAFAHMKKLLKEK